MLARRAAKKSRQILVLVTWCEGTFELSISEALNVHKETEQTEKRREDAERPMNVRQV